MFDYDYHADDDGMVRGLNESVCVIATWEYRVYMTLVSFEQSTGSLKFEPGQISSFNGRKVYPSHFSGFWLVSSDLKLTTADLPATGKLKYTAIIACQAK